MTALIVGVAVGAAILAGAGPAPHRLPADGSRRVVWTWPSREHLIATIDRAVPSHRRRRRDQQLPDAIDRLASSLRAGVAVGPALVALAYDVPDPLGGELRAVARAVEHGAPVIDALGAWGRSAGASRDVELVCSALTIGAGAGGELARAVDGIAATLRERHELRAELRMLATQARASAAVLAGAPVVFALLVASIEPAAVGFLFTTPVGLGCLVLGIGLDVVGLVWMARLTGTVG